MSAFLHVHAQLEEPLLAFGLHRARIRHPTGRAQAEAQLGCPFTALAGSEYGDAVVHQRTLRVTMVTTASRMPTIQKRAVILLSGMPPFW